MQRVALGKHGPSVSEIGIGMWQAGGTSWGSDVRDRDCVAAMVRGVELGMNLADTAEVYGDGHSEQVVGRAIRRVGRDRVFLATSWREVVRRRGWLHAAYAVPLALAATVRPAKHGAGLHTVALATALGGAAAAGGYLASWFLQIPTGATMVALAGLMFAGAWALRTSRA